MGSSTSTSSWPAACSAPAALSIVSATGATGVATDDEVTTPTRQRGSSDVVPTGGTGTLNGSRASNPDIASTAKRTSATDRASGPWTNID